MTNQKICNTCVLPIDTLPNSTHSENCRLCNSPDLLQHINIKSDNDKLLQMIEQIRQKGKGQPYDCVVAWSGGRDSTFMLHQLVVKHNLRCVAVFGRTPFTPIEIVNSVHSIAEKLKIKLIEIETPSNHREIAGYCLMEYTKTHLPILINLACASCKFVNKSLFKQAKKLSAKTVIYGGNRYEYFPSGPASIDINSEDRYSFFNMVRDNITRLFKGVGIILKAPTLLKYCLTFFKASVLYINQYSVYLRLRYPNIDRFDYYHHADWDENTIHTTLKELGWQLPAGCNSTWRADCVFEAVKNAAFKQQLGFTYAQAMYSNLIRSGKITRSEALERLEKEGISEPRLKEALRLCGLPEDAIGVKD